MKKHLFVAFGLVAAGGGVLVTSGSVSAAPKNEGITIVLSNCTDPAFNGTVVTAPGNGNWTPAFHGSTTLVPVWFGAFTGTYSSPDGGGLINDPPAMQNAGKGGNNQRVTCDDAVSGQDGEFSFSGTGSVTLAVVSKP